MENREKKIRNVTIVGAVINIILTVVKIIVGIVGKSAALVADGVHSLSDLLSDVVVLVFSHISFKGKDKGHSFGHGKFETLATLIVSVILVVVGAEIMADGVKTIISVINGEVLPVPSSIALWAALISIVSKEILYQVTAKVGRNVKSTVVIANAWHHRSDAISSVGVLVGIGCAILFGEKWTILDPIVSCVISIFIIVVAIQMAMPSLAELLDASLPKKINEEIIDISMSVDGVRDVHDLKTRRSGMSMIINAHVVVSPNISVVEAHEIATNVESAITEKFGHETQISIHIEPDLQSL